MKLFRMELFGATEGWKGEGGGVMIEIGFFR